MVQMPASQLRLMLTGYDYWASIAAPAYLIDRYEVTNAEYKEFVDAGGYTNETFWQQEFVENGQTVSWEEAMDRFKDMTGRPGPANWQGGTYPGGEAEHPVGGVSWYEAAAYAEFRGKELPTVYHWLGPEGTYDAAEVAPLGKARQRVSVGVPDSPVSP